MYWMAFDPTTRIRPRGIDQVESNRDKTRLKQKSPGKGTVTKCHEVEAMR